MTAMLLLGHAVRADGHGWDWVLLSTGNLKFRQWEPDGANGELQPSPILKGAEKAVTFF
jgi:hypothetical protein